MICLLAAGAPDNPWCAGLMAPWHVHVVKPKGKQRASTGTANCRVFPMSHPEHKCEGVGDMEVRPLRLCHCCLHLNKHQTLCAVQAHMLCHMLVQADNICHMLAQARRYSLARVTTLAVVGPSDVSADTTANATQHSALSSLQKASSSPAQAACV